MLLIGAILFCSGCAADPADKANLTAGYSALDARQYDAAIRSADDQLAHSGGGESSAEALYLKGRAYEQRVKADEEQSRSDLNTAASFYQQALSSGPSKQLEGYIHASLANVDYWLDNYTSAIAQFSAAYDLVDSADLKSFILYRAGLCQQRLAQFDVADKSFQAVQDRFPGSEAARRAREHQGFRNFSVRVATFSTTAAAQSAAAALIRTGLDNVQVRLLADGKSIVLVGPESTFTEASAMKVRVAGQYPDAMIVP
jgi:outer membrane protein assembly factor BamD (BamD/ComL family)